MFSSQYKPLNRDASGIRRFITGVLVVSAANRNEQRAQDDNQGRHGDSQCTHHDNHTVMMKTTSNQMTAREDMVKAETHIMTAITVMMKT